LKLNYTGNKIKSKTAQTDSHSQRDHTSFVPHTAREGRLLCGHVTLHDRTTIDLLAVVHTVVVQTAVMRSAFSVTVKTQ